MKPTHIVYNPEGKPDGLYVITEMPIKPEWKGAIGHIQMAEYQKAVQSAIASAIKVIDEDVSAIYFALGLPYLENQKERIGKVYGIELEVYNSCKDPKDCCGFNLNCRYLVQLARIKEPKQLTDDEKLEGAKMLANRSVVNQWAKVEPKQEEQQKWTPNIKDTLIAYKTEQITLSGAVNEITTYTKESLVEPKENQDKLFQEMWKTFGQDNGVEKAKEQFLITRK